jgi:hypothetical protein
MTDFLTNVTARSFGAETAIRPRVASLFEPIHSGDNVLRDVSAKEPAMTAVASEVEATDGAPNTLNEDHVPTIGPRLRGTSARRETSAIGENTMQVENTVLAAKMRPFGVLSSQPSSGTSLPPAKNVEDEMAAEQRPRTALLSQPVNSNVSEPRFSRSDFEHDAPKYVSAKTPATSPIHDEPAEGNNRPLVLPPNLLGELTAQMKNAAAVSAPSNVPARRNRENASPPADPGPNVHVTIGRIEVRATSETKHVGRTQATSTVMSLDEYLRRRTQRGDR